MLKYTPEHMHCLANIYAAQAPPNTGVLALRSTAANQKVPDTIDTMALLRMNPDCSYLRFAVILNSPCVTLHVPVVWPAEQ